MEFNTGGTADSSNSGAMTGGTMASSIYKNGGGLKPIPKGNKGLPKLPKSVRNKMGYMAKGGSLKGKQKKLGLGGRVSNINDATATSDLKDELRSKMKKGDDVIHFAYTDYGGDFMDKVAIEYFEENYPKNTLSETTAYYGKNAFVFGKPATEWIESTEDYPLGFEDFESYYYEKQNEQENEDFERFLDDLKRDGYEVSDEAIGWLNEKKGGYYNITTQGLDFSYSDLEDELKEEGLITKDKMAQGGGVGDSNKYLVRYSQTNQQVEVLEDIIPVLNKYGIKLNYGTSVGKRPQTIIFDKRYQDSILRINADGYESEYLPEYDGEEFRDASDLEDILKNSQSNEMAKGGGTKKNITTKKTKTMDKKWSKKIDKAIKAKKPGFRKSPSGGYYEYRSNRSDANPKMKLEWGGTAESSETGEPIGGENQSSMFSEGGNIGGFTYSIGGL